jgi:hypothetical protein
MKNCERFSNGDNLVWTDNAGAVSPRKTRGCQAHNSNLQQRDAGFRPVAVTNLARAAAIVDNLPAGQGS